MIGLVGLPHTGNLSDRDVRPGPRVRRLGLGSSAATTVANDAQEALGSPWSQPQEAMRIHLAQAWVSANLEPLLGLPFNWDRHGAHPVQDEVASTAERALVQLLRQGVVPPTMFPTPDGGLSVEWHRPSMEFALQFTGGHGEQGTVAYFADDSTGEEWEEDLSTAMPRVKEILASLADNGG